MNKLLSLVLLSCLALPLMAESKPTPTPSPKATPAPAATPAPKATPAPSATPAPTATPAPSPTPAPTPSPADVSYALGLLVGQSIKSTELDIDVEQVFQGIRDSRSDKPAKYTLDEAKQIAQQAIGAAQQKKQAALADKEKGFLADHAKNKGVVTTASGLQYEVLKLGTGDKPKVTDTVKVNYVGTLTDGTEFDSSIKRGEPAVFPLGQVIPAWTEGLQLMPVGSKFRFTVPSSLAYGAEGAGGVIPPYATLVFEVDLIDIEAPAAEAAPEESPAPSPAPAQ
jgi:FKBP-type peptidyl-prolyl cis-trans isomerase